jgi:hypothetical protein
MRLQSCLHFEFCAIASGSTAFLAAPGKIKERPVGARPLGGMGLEGMCQTQPTAAAGLGRRRSLGDKGRLS